MDAKTLLSENFYDHKKIIAFARRKFLDKKISLLVETFLLVENFFDKLKIFARGRLSWSRKNLCL